MMVIYGFPIASPAGFEHALPQYCDLPPRSPKLLPNVKVGMELTSDSGSARPARDVTEASFRVCGWHPRLTISFHMHFRESRRPSP